MVFVNRKHAIVFTLIGALCGFLFSRFTVSANIATASVASDKLQGKPSQATGSVAVNKHEGKPLLAQRHVLKCDKVCGELLKFIVDERRKSSWNVYYDGMAQKIRSLFPDDSTFTFIEIGTAWGGVGDYLLQHVNNMVFFGVDPFLADYDKGDAQSDLLAATAVRLKISPLELSFYWAAALSYDIGTSQKRGERYNLIHDFSCPASQRFEDDAADVMFVDGLHTKKGVLMDILCWSRVLKDGHWFIFNDYTSSWPGVQSAVQYFAKITGQTVQMLDGHGNAMLKNVKGAESKLQQEIDNTPSK